MGDSSKTLSDSTLNFQVNALRGALENDRARQFDANREYIMSGIKRELLTAVQGDSASTAFMLRSDAQVKEAIRYLSDMELYKKAISAPSKTQEKPAKKKNK